MVTNLLPKRLSASGLIGFTLAIACLLTTTAGAQLLADKSSVKAKPVADKVVEAPINAQSTEDSPRRRFEIPVNERGLKPLAKTFSVTGEVVDAWCYASQVMGAGRGEAHKPCGLACAHGGVTIGIVDDTGKLYIAAKSKGFTGCKDLLTPFMAKRVKITGWLATKGGSNILKIQKVELAE